MLGIQYFVIGGQQRFRYHPFRDNVQLKSGRPFFAPFVRDRINALVHFTKNILLSGRKENIGGIVFVQVSSEHSFAGNPVTGPVKVFRGFRAGKRKG